MPGSFPTPAYILRSMASATPAPIDRADSAGVDLEPSPFVSIANALSVPPIHVDHVAEAICKVILNDEVEGVVDVERMRRLIGWSHDEQATLTEKEHA